MSETNDSTPTESVRPVKTAVIGAGAFGRHHVRIHHSLPGSDLVCVVDQDPEIRAHAEETYGVRAVASVEELPDDLEAVSVAVPTPLHHQVALPLLERGVSTLIEKPMVRTLEEGRDLIAAAEASGAILQVGHVERFNPAVRAIQDHKISPRFIEAARVAPFSFRSADVGVVMDLMIHDIDIVLHLAGSKPVRVEAVGVPVLTQHEDIANARVTFENGCVATLTASRVATKTERKIRVFSPAAYLVVDFGEREGFLYRRSPDLTLEKVMEMKRGAKSLADLKGAVFGELLTAERLTVPSGDALTAEIEHFLDCVRDRARPEVSGHEGLAAVSLALQILEAIRTSPAAQ
jgi:predicted dehydrogenase